MNVENILRVADAIEQHIIPDLGFNMGCRHPEPASEEEPDMSGHKCGTIACIAGWADAIFGDGGSQLVFKDLSYTQYEALIMPKGWSDNIYSSAQAVRTLRRLADTYQRTGVGIVEWDLPESVEA